MTDPMAPRALDLVKEFEGYHRKQPNGDAVAYADPVGVWTIAFGCTYYENGRKVRKGDRVTRERGEELLANQMLIYLGAVDKAIKVPMHPWMRGACGSLAYNVGTAGFRRSTLARMINQKRWSEVPRAFGMWRYAGGRVYKGLVRRRNAEATLFMAGLRQMQDGYQKPVTPPLPARNTIRPSGNVFQRFWAWLRGER